MQPSPTHQNVRLTRGKHNTPRDGVCVMELASMLAGERFDDRPRSVDPMLATFLRTYNDGVDDTRRQDLYGVAAAVVGTRTGWSSSRRRAARLRAELGRPFTARMMTRELLATTVAQRLLSRGADGHARVLALVRDLVGEDGGLPAAPPLRSLADAGR